MAPRNRIQAPPFRRMRLVEVNEQLANEQAAEKFIRHDDPIISSMARVLPEIRNPRRTKNATADLAVSTANMQHYKALERQRRSEEVQRALERELEMEPSAIAATPKPKTKPKRAKQTPRKPSVGLFSPRRTRKQETVLKVYK